MKHFINRNYDRTEHDDFLLNIEKHCVYGMVAVPQYHPEDSYILGWMIQTVTD